MPDHIVRTSGDRKAKAKESLFPNRSVWMSHWIQGSCNTTVPASESHSNVAANDSKEENCEIMLRPLLALTADSLPSKSDIYAGPGNISEKGKGWDYQQGETVVAACVLDSAKAIGTRTAEDRLMITNDAMALDSRNIKFESSGRDPFLKFNINHRIDVNPVSKKAHFSGKRASKPQIIDYYDRGTASISTSFPGSYPSLLRLGPTETELPLENCLQEHASMSRKSMRLSKHEESFERKSLPVSMPFEDNFLRFKVPYGVAGEMLMRSGVKESNQSSLQAILRKHFIDAKLAYLDDNNGCQFERRPPTHSVHDVETLRICATVDSAEAVDGSTSKFSQTTHRLLITKRSDLNLLSEDEMIKKSKQNSKGKGSESHDLFRFPIDFGSHELGGKLRSLGNVTELAGEMEVGKLDTDSLRLKSDSSAETDSMDIDNFPAKDALMGFVASPSTKGFNVKRHTPRTQATALMPGNKSRGHLEKTEWHEFIQSSPSLAVAESSMENRGASSSRTESLDAEHLLSYDEQPNNSSASKPDSGETSNRWVKRLKLSASDSTPPGVESSRMRAEAFSTGSTNRSKPVLIKPVDKGSLEMDENSVKERKTEPLSINSAVKELRNQTLSHPWIRRWSHNQAATGKSKVTEAVICEPQSLEASLDEFQRKKLPSIAAMALMGKATNCFQPCQLRRKGPVVVWTTDSF
ncbi:hypothetical protein Sjap_010315 [Stephania japonica]|uniref:Uncharacterized protein n=1 Tax=Stephania japonica TaxID=461633 RepID=A0AAP0JBD7_9MAGN